MLTLGIPGDAVTAVIIGALYIHGLKPGPMLMIETPHLFWFCVGNLFLANCFLLPFGLSGIKIFAKIVETPKAILLPLILVLSAVGTYAIENNPTHVYWMLGFGVLGYFLKMYGFQVGPVILGIILGPLIDVSYRRAMISDRRRSAAVPGRVLHQPRVDRSGRGARDHRALPDDAVGQAVGYRQARRRLRGVIGSRGAARTPDSTPSIRYLRPPDAPPPRGTMR